MAFASLNGGFFWPDYFPNVQFGQTTETGHLIDASGEALAFIFTAPKTGNIDRVHGRVNTKTTNGTLTLTLETVDATNGRPTGTLVGTGATGTFAVTATGPVDVTFGATLPAVTKGTQYAFVITQGTPGNCTISLWRAQTGSGFLMSRLNYVMHFQGGSWNALSASPANVYRPSMAIRYDDGNYYYIPNAFPVSARANTAYNSGSDPVERGMFFTLPFPARAAGFYWQGASHSGDWKVILANTSGTELASFTGDKDQASFYAAGSQYGGVTMGYFPTAYDLVANTKYYLTVRPTTATSIAIEEDTLLDTGIAGMMGMFNGGTAVGQVRRAAAGSYTETTTARPYGMGLIFSAFDDGAGSGGGLLRHPGMLGGLNA